MDEAEDNELGIRVSVHLIGEALEAKGYRFWCHDVGRRESTRHDCAIQKESPQGGKYTPISFALDFVTDRVNGYVRVIQTDEGSKSKFKDYLLADPDVTNQVVDAILRKGNG